MLKTEEKHGRLGSDVVTVTGHEGAAAQKERQLSPVLRYFHTCFTRLSLRDCRLHDEDNNNYFMRLF